MPWYINGSDMSQEPGITRLIVHFFGGLIGMLGGRFESGIPAFLIGITMILVFVLSVNILIKNKMDNWEMKKTYSVQ